MLLCDAVLWYNGGRSCLNIFCGAYAELNLQQASTISKMSRLWFWTRKNWSACFEHTVFQLLLSCLSNFSVFEFLSLLSKNFRLQHWKTYQRILKLFWYCKIINQKLILVQYQYLFQSYLRNKFSEKIKIILKTFIWFLEVSWYFMIFYTERISVTIRGQTLVWI